MLHASYDMNEKRLISDYYLGNVCLGHNIEDPIEIELIMHLYGGLIV